MTKRNVRRNAISSEIENCRCLEVGVERFGECLKQGPATCSYALPFGYCFLCTHPNLDVIIETTKKTQLVPVPIK